jgi:hypothetical protein
MYRQAKGNRMDKYKGMRKIRQIEEKVELPIEVFLEQEYNQNRKSTHQIGEEVGVGGITIHRWMKKFGIRPRSVIEGIRVENNLDLIDDHLTTEEEQVIRGSILGDGGIYTRNKKKAYFAEGHGIKQEQYLKWKTAKLVRLRPKFRYPVSKKTGKTECRIDTSPFQCLETLRKEFYTDKKHITRDSLNRLTPLSIAIWYQDDAYRIPKGGVRLMTCDFSTDEHNIVIQYFKEVWDINCKIEYTAEYKNGKRYPYIKFLAAEAEKLIDIITPYIESSMLYKIFNKGRCENTNPNPKRTLEELFEERTGASFKIFLEKEYAYNQRTLKSIGKELGVHDTSILLWLEKFGIKTRSRGEARRLRASKETKTQIQEMD